MSGRNSQPGNGNNCICGGWRQHYPVTITTYNYENEPIEMTFEKAPEKVFAYATPISKSFWHLVSVIRS